MSNITWKFADYHRGLLFVGAFGVWLGDLGHDAALRRSRAVHCSVRGCGRPQRRRILHDQRIQIGRAAAARGPDGRNGERDVGPILAGVLGNLGAANQFERGLAIPAAGVSRAS